MAVPKKARRTPRTPANISARKPSSVRRGPRALALAPTRGSRAGSRAARARAVADTDTVSVTYTLRDVHGDLVHDPEGIFTFRRQKDRRQIAEQAQLALRGAAVRFAIPAGDDVVQGEIDLQRYRFTRSPLFIRAVGFPRTFDGLLLREPGQWQPAFTQWGALSASFSALRGVLSASTDIALIGTERRLPSLAGTAYDTLAGSDAILAKAALLNIHYRLRTAGPPIVGAEPWFSLVTRIVAVGQERFVAWAKPDLAHAVRDVIDNIDDLGDDFERADSSLHRKNVPADMQSRVLDMVSIKSTHATGNYQLTVITFTGTDDVLLDADIDESGTFWAHARDVFKHKITGGTHPVDVHEILVRQDGTQPGFDLGYTLV
jgi:hypothetical protein